MKTLDVKYMAELAQGDQEYRAQITPIVQSLVREFIGREMDISTPHPLSTELLQDRGLLHALQVKFNLEHMQIQDVGWMTPDQFLNYITQNRDGAASTQQILRAHERNIRERMEGQLA